MSETFDPEIKPDYKPVDIKSEPDFSSARITGVLLTSEDEDRLRVQAGKVVEAGNNLLGYSRGELARLCGIKSSQFSKIIKGEAWLNIGSLGLWGFATGITPTDVVQLAPLHANPATCMSWFMNGRLHHFDHDEFELVTKLICRRLGLRHVRVNVAGDEPVPKLRDPSWQEMYLDDLSLTVGKRIAQLRHVLDLSQKHFADIVGITADTVKRYESGIGRMSRGVFTSYRLYATLNVTPIEMTRGSIHHKLRYVQEQRQQTLIEITKQLNHVYYQRLKEITLGLSKT